MIRVTLLIIFLLISGWAMADSATQQAVALAKAELANQKNIDPQSMVVIETQPKQWPNSALGCPEPGKIYAQVIVPGYAINIRAAGGVYTVHTGGNRAVICSSLNNVK